MAGRTLLQLIADVIRESRRQTSHAEARQAVLDVFRFLDGAETWEFLAKSTNLRTEASYNVGTVSVSAGDVTLTGVGTAWSASWDYKTIKFSGRKLPYDIDFFGSATSASLFVPLSGTTNIAAGTYKIYQARYALPSDCEPGRDMAIKGPLGTGRAGDGRISKRERLYIEEHSDLELDASSPTMFYTDDNYDDAGAVPTIRFYPAPTQNDQEFRLTYYRKMTVPTTEGGTVIVPESFDRMIVLMAASRIMRNNSMQGWLEKAVDAKAIMKSMTNRYAISPAYENVIEPEYGDRHLDSFLMDNQFHVRY